MPVEVIGGSFNMYGLTPDTPLPKINRTASLLVLSFLAIIFGAVPAHANAGTFMMWTGTFHLLFGNAIIGYFEAFLLWRIYQIAIDFGKATPRLILANYTSMILGGLGLAIAGAGLKYSLDNALFLLLSMILVSYLATVAIEWPFYHFSFDKSKRHKLTSLKASFIVNAVSYAILAVIYALVGNIGLITAVSHSQVNVKDFGDDYIVYYINPNDGNVYMFDAHTQSTALTYRLQSRGNFDRLYATPNDSGSWDLYAAMKCAKPDSFCNKQICHAFSRFASRSWRDSVTLANHARSQFDFLNTWWNFGEAADLRKAPSQLKYAYTEFWPGMGLHLSFGSGEKKSIGFETPFGSILFRNATILPNDRIVLQMNDDICIYNAKNNRMAKLIRGRGPVVVMKEDIP
ncbi:MAG TPA: hypothetical protein VLX68_13025 [Chitinivibrionales bacterium]|nr:hypothetical protein [Chitinivibrionales bacterium]